MNGQLTTSYPTPSSLRVCPLRQLTLHAKELLGLCCNNDQFHRVHSHGRKCAVDPVLG